MQSRPADEFANEFELSLATKFTAYRCGIWLNETRLAERLTTEWMEEIIDLLQARRVAEPFEIDCAFGSAFHAMGDSTLALRFYEEALRVQRDPTVLHDMACLLLQNNQIEYAEKALRASYVCAGGFGVQRGA